jgi:hypothetical protein
MSKMHRTPARQHAIALAAAALLGPLALAPAAAASCTWNSTNGNWNELAKWLACVTGNGNPAGSPGAADSAVIGATGVVAVTTGQSVNTLNNAGTVNITTGSLRLLGPTITNSGSITVGQGGLLAAQAGQTIGGGGSIVFADSNTSNRLNLEGTGNIVLGAGTTVRGHTGFIGQQAFVGGTVTLTNNGAISADVGGGTITLATNGGTTNNGVLSALNGGTLLLNTAVNNTASGQIIAGAGSTVVQNGVTLNGVINVSGTGTFRASNSGSNFLDAATFSGTLDLASATGGQRITNGLTLNAGVINIGTGSVLAAQGDQSFSGNGSIVFADSNTSNRFNLEAGNLTLGAGVTVRGHTGFIGQQAFLGGAATLTNNGTISADVAGGTITLATNGGTTNNGTLSAQNGGTLLLNTAVTNNPAGQIVVGTGSTVVQNGVALNGVINVSGGGTFRANNSGNNFLNAATFTGVLDLASTTAVERVTGGLVLNNSTIRVGNGSVLAPQGDQTFSGTGTILFADNNSGNRFNLEAGDLTLGAGVVVRGDTGFIGQQSFVGGTAKLINNGTISADVAGGTITLAPNGGTTNNGTLSAQNGGTLLLNTNVVNNASGQILAGAGSTVVQNGVVLSGALNVNGTGTFRPSNNGNNFLDAVSLTGNLDMASAASVEQVRNGLALNNSTIRIGSGSVLAPRGDQAFSGTGTILFADNNTSNRLNLEAGDLTLGANITVRGDTGFIGQQSFLGGTSRLINNGTISADVSGGTITLAPNGGTTNNGTLSAQNGGTLLLNSAVSSTAAGQILAGTGSTVVQNGVTLSGPLNITGTGTFRPTNNANNFLNAVTLAGTIDLASMAAVERVTGGLALNAGVILIGAGSVLAPQGVQSISGTGSIVFADSNTSNGLNLEAGALTLDAGVTVRGHTGFIGRQSFIGGAASLINNGTIHAEVAGGTITVSPNNGLTGSGTLQTSGGAINLATTSNSTQGRLVMGGAGSALNLNARDLTLSIDYTNAQAGTGNSFDRRAGITGTGKVLAAGDVAQVITGAGVSNGNTNNATLTISNLRVGANTLNYQIGNAGTTGPTLRGAIQTNVNGGNLTDARLSGSGVTAANYNAGGPGANSGNQSVVFTAASAGALAPLTGQVLNLRSNFENIADQKLNIVLASNAAAYNAAVGVATPAPVVVANQRVGASNSVALTVSNSAAPGAFSEDLKATFGSNTGAAINSGGVVSSLVAGASNNSAMGVRVDTSSAGAKTGSVTLNYETLGTVNGVSNGLAVAGANAPQTINVSGNVYQVASGALVSAPLNFGTVQVGQVVSQNLVVRNSASGPAGFVEDLNASFGAASGTGAGLISGSGSFSGIAAGNNSTAANGSMVVSVNTTAAGTVNGNILVNYFTAGAVGGVTNNLGAAAVGSEAYGVQGSISALANVINQASPLINTPTLNLGAARVGGAALNGNVSVTNVATVAPQAALNASIAPTSGPISASGSFNLLNPGATNTSSLAVSMSTATAGNFSGANAAKATVSLVSDANNVGNCTPNCQLSLASQVVDLVGKIYTQAVGTVSTALVDFGIVRVGDSVAARNVSVNNTAASTALNDTLRGDLTGLSGALGTSGPVSAIGTQSSGNIGVTLNTTSAGIYSQIGTVGLTSQNADMADVSAGADVGVTVKAQVNNLASALFTLALGSGTLSQIGNTFFVDYGNLNLGDTLATTLALSNQATGPADDLDGAFDVSGAGAFNLSNWNAFSGLQAGNSLGGFGLGYAATNVGGFTQTIALNGRSVNASDPQGIARSWNVVLRGNVLGGNPNPVPEPGTVSLVLLAAAAGWATRRRVASKYQSNRPAKQATAC